MADGLTAKQRMVWEFICDFRGERGFSPTMREIAEGLGLKNKCSSWCHIRALRKKKYLSDEQKSTERTFAPTIDGIPLVSLAALGIRSDSLR